MRFRRIKLKAVKDMLDGEGARRFSVARHGVQVAIGQVPRLRLTGSAQAASNSRNCCWIAWLAGMSSGRTNC